MKEVWIFGDSFASPSEEGWAWTNLLAQNYRVKNFAQGGTSIDWSIQQLLDRMDSEPTKDITVLFFLTDTLRINFKFWKEASHQVLAKRILWPDQGVERFLKDELHTYSNKREFIHNFFHDYLLHSTYTRTEEQKCVLLLNHYAKQFKQMIIWRPFNTQDQAHDFTLEKNCKVIDIPIGTFTQVDAFIDEDPNHLDKKKHRVMHKILSECIYSGITPTIEHWNVTENLLNN